MLVYFSLTSVLIIRTKHIITVDHNSSKTIHYYFTKTLQVTYTVCSTTWNNASTFSSKNLCSICCNVSLWCLSVATMLSFICKKIGHNFNIFKEQIQKKLHKHWGWISKMVLQSQLQVKQSQILFLKITGIPHPAPAAFVLSFSWIPWQVSAQIAWVWPEKYCYTQIYQQLWSLTTIARFLMSWPRFCGNSSIFS